MSRTYTVDAKRWEHGWELHVEGLGVTQASGLSDAQTLDVELPAVLPALGVDRVGPAHCSHPSSRYVNVHNRLTSPPRESISRGTRERSAIESVNSLIVS